MQNLRPRIIQIFSDVKKQGKASNYGRYGNPQIMEINKTVFLKLNVLFRVQNTSQYIQGQWFHLHFYNLLIMNK